MAVEYIAYYDNQNQTWRLVPTDRILVDGATVDFQLIKVALGADGEFDTLLDAGQQLAAVSIPVVLASDAALPAGDNNIGNVDIASALPAGNNNIGNVGIVSPLPAGENHVGQVSGNTKIVNVTPTLDISAYAVGNILFDTIEIPNAARANDTPVILQSVVVIDKDEQATKMDLHFFDANVSLGTVNTVPAITDVNAENYLGKVTVSADAYADLGDASVASIDQIGLILQPASGSTSIYVAAVSQSTPTHTANGMVVRFGFLRD